MANLIVARWTDYGMQWDQDGTQEIESGPVLRAGDRVGVIESRDVSRPDSGQVTAYPEGNLPPHHADGRSFTQDNRWRRLVGYGTVRAVQRGTERRRATVEVEMD